MTLAATAVKNAQAYDWKTWLMGIMRSFISGGAAALVTGSGGAALGIQGWKVWALMGINFISLGLYRMGEFLVLHGAPDQVQEKLETAAVATQAASAAIADAKLSHEAEKKDGGKTNE